MGCVNSVSRLVRMGLSSYPRLVAGKRLNFAGQDLVTLSDNKRRKITGKDIAMVFQEPMTSLSPCFSVGFQIMETLKVQEGGSLRDRV